MRKLAAYSAAAVAGIVGIGSLSAFGVFLWTGGFGVVDLRMPRTLALLWDSGLCLLFFLQHSGMLRRGVRAWLERVVPAHAHGIVYTYASGAALLLLLLAWQPFGPSLYTLEGAARYLARGVLLLSLLGVPWAFISLRAFDGFGIDAFLAHVAGRAAAAPRLTIAGPYRLVRHPFYFCGIVALWATPVLPLDRLVFNALFTVWIAIGATLEERDLVHEFGEDYRAYQRTTPMLIPHRR